MIRFGLLAFAMLAFAALGRAADDARDEMKKLEGTWKVASAAADGKPLDVKNLGITRIVVSDGKLTFQNESKTLMTCSFTVDLSKKPKQMDWKKDKDPNALPTIYSLDGNELKLCFPLLPKKGNGDKVDIKRPASFDTKGTSFASVTLKREKK